MRARILDLDAGLTQQTSLLEYVRPEVIPLTDWGPRLRLACRFGRFRQFENELARRASESLEPSLTFLGSGDFHHVSLALIRKIRTPFNLLVIDNHPDWMHSIPFMHCGTWLYHAAQLPNVRRIYHVGGDVDFDNEWRLCAPYRLLRDGKIVVFPGIRRYDTGEWKRIRHSPLRSEAKSPVTLERIEHLLRPFEPGLARWPLYVSLDKDVMQTRESVVNWDSGHLTLDEVQKVLRAFFTAANSQLVGMDVVGDWSPVRLEGLFRRFLDWIEHPALDVDSADARRINERTNLTLVQNVVGATTHAPGSLTPGGGSEALLG
jgi:arginase family enzyme